LLEFLETPRSKAEILDHLARDASDEPRLWWALKTYAPLVHAPTGRPWCFDTNTHYERASTLDRPPINDAIRSLVLRYLGGFGPATIADFAQFSLQPMSVARAAFDAMRDELVAHRAIDGNELFDLPGAPDLPSPGTPALPRIGALEPIDPNDWEALDNEARLLSSALWPTVTSTWLGGPGPGGRGSRSTQLTPSQHDPRPSHPSQDFERRVRAGRRCGHLDRPQPAPRLPHSATAHLIER
jgi:hypothetical protein